MAPVRPEREPDPILPEDWDSVDAIRLTAVTAWH